MTYQDKRITTVNYTYHWTQLLQYATSYRMNFFNLGAPKLTLYRYTKLMDSFLKRRYTRPINHCSQLSTTWLSDHGSRSKSKWILLGLWGDGVFIVPECSLFFIYIHIFLWTLCAHFKIENQTHSRIIICPWIIGCHLIFMPAILWRQAT